MTVPAILPTLPPFPVPPAAQLRRIAAQTVQRLCPELEPLTVAEWADKYRQLPETSASPGPYDSSVTPYARRWQNLLADPDVEMVVLCWAAQTTKSTVLENGIGYRIARMPTPMVIVQPKIDAAENWAKERFDPMVRATPALAERVRLGRATDSTLRYKRFAGGFLFVASAQSATELASRSAPFILLDEVDRYEVIPGEGNPVEIALKRQGATDVACAALTSTPRDEETTIIWPYLEGGTYELYHVPCPHCGLMQPLWWRGLRWEPGKPGTAQYLCGAGDQADDGTPLGCGALIDEAAKTQMLARGAWVATNPGAPYPSSHLNALYSPFKKSSWGALAGEWERAHGKPADLQVFINTVLAELWKETAEVLDKDAVLNRLEPMGEGIVPEGVGLLTAGVDVQHNRLEVYVWGWGAGLQSWLVASHIIPGDPLQEPDKAGSCWAALDDYLATRFEHASGRTVPIAAAFVDSGYATSKVYRYTRRRRGRKIYACKGVGGAGLPLVGKPTLQGKERTVVYPIGTDTAKDEFLRSQIQERRIGPGFVHLPAWLTPDQCEQLVGEKRKRFLHRGRVTYEWRPKREDQAVEALDCRNYARGALETFGPKVIARLAKRATKLALPPDEESPRAAADRDTDGADDVLPDPAAPTPVASPTSRSRGPKRQSPRRGGWVTGRRGFGR